jgi:hypothetical protein
MVINSLERLINYVKYKARGTKVQDVLGQMPRASKPMAITIENDVEYNPDAEVTELMHPVLNPVIAFHEALRAGGDKSKCTEGNPFAGIKLEVEDAWLFEGRLSESGKLLKRKETGWPSFYLVRRLQGTDAYVARMKEAESEWASLGEKAKNARELVRYKREAVRALKNAKLLEQGSDAFDFGFDSYGLGPYDMNQYTEYTPLYGGPFFKQLYIADYLKMHSRAYEAWNHNPVAKRIIEILSQYAFGRRFKVRIEDKVKEKAWKAFDRKYKIVENVSQYWIREYLIYGEIMINLETYQLIDPSTVWDIITDPDNLKDVYYYYQSYPTAYQMFTGYRVPDQPGAQDVRAQKYIVRQIPAWKVLHVKGNCVSNEKRGRSTLFPVLGWLKRIKDLYNAIVIRQWLLSCFIWDDTIKGSAADVQAHASQYVQMPSPGSTFAHNESVERKPMPAIDSSGGRGNASGIGEELLSFIATAVGVPKEFFNVISTGGGSRAQALTSAEPFTKVIEDIQAKFEALLIEIARYAFVEAGLEYVEGDVEFIFPSVTKDTTTETIKNLATAESMGWLSKQTAAEMAATELNITKYDFEDEQGKITDEMKKGINQMGSTPPPPGGRFGTDSPAEDDGLSDIHGQGKVDLSKALKNL